MGLATLEPAESTNLVRPNRPALGTRVQFGYANPPPRAVILLVLFQKWEVEPGPRREAVSAQSASSTELTPP